ncbi:hypothetical protein FEM48_Zijuj04G0137900 [Ziziphus jujuba var. spinosa]|uniref:Uncharacterized protein n=1 Tax=Ziziphus jujuba var. spinosa TaxID=714518 RepID=A0A978VK84_ZIZJJ|nr:hypothetical protein FEM48_Zijuj04G0137900 [Ziziphus jujuba var. spinosa]
MRRVHERGMELAMELGKELGKRLGMELAMELGKELGKRLVKSLILSIIGHAAIGATHILNMCTMLEKVKQRNKIHQATIAMLSQMSSNEGRLPQILAGLPQNQPADDPAHWSGDVQEVGQEAGQGVGPGAEGLDWVLGQHEAISWEGHGAGHGAGQEAGQGAGHGAHHGAREGDGQEAGQGAVGLDCALGQHEVNYNQMTICRDDAVQRINQILDVILATQLPDLFEPNIGHVSVGATHILNMCTILEKAKQRNKIHQATIAMLSQMSSNEGRLLRILAGLPQNQPANDPGHWPGDVQEVWQEEAIRGRGMEPGKRLDKGAGEGAGREAWPGVEGPYLAVGQHEGLGKELGNEASLWWCTELGMKLVKELGSAGQGAGPRTGQRVGPGAEGLDWVLGQHEAVSWEGHGAGQEAGHEARHGGREGAGQDDGQDAGLGAVGFDSTLGQHETNYNQMPICRDDAVQRIS